MAETAVPSEDVPYAGRFAPSPTGLLHFGSLVAAVGSYADALHHGGIWRVRIADIDETRTVSGMAEAILRQLEGFGFSWHGEPVYQTRRKSIYSDIVGQLVADGLAFYCNCSRKDILLSSRTGPQGPIYPGTCRRVPPPGDRSLSIRLITDQARITFSDRFAGPVDQNLAFDVGDYVIHRSDGFAAYQLAVVVDDHLDRITHVVRGADLLYSTPRQIHLQTLLGYERPAYGHLPIVLDDQGRKLSKQDKDRPVSADEPLPSLLAAWEFLSQPTPEWTLQTTDEFWAFASTNWNTSSLTIPEYNLLDSQSKQN